MEKVIRSLQYQTLDKTDLNRSTTVSAHLVLFVYLLLEFLYEKLFGANILILVLFLIPYAVSLVLVAMPMMLLEIALGQYTSNSTLTCWKMAPIFRGIVNIWAFIHSKHHL